MRSFPCLSYKFFPHIRVQRNISAYPRPRSESRNRAQLDFGNLVQNAYDKVKDVKGVQRCALNGERMNQSRILPFYMAYPLPLYYQEEDTVTRDLEYLQQMYPMEAKKYQKIIAETLDRLDYEGSMIYDEYPDRWQIYRLTQVIVDKIKKMEGEEAAASRNGQGADDNGATDIQETNGRKDTNIQEDVMRAQAVQEKDWDRITEFVQVLLCYEIYRKRHSNRNGILKF